MDSFLGCKNGVRPFLILLLFLPFLAYSGEICPGIIVHDLEAKSLNFTDTEKRLLCGDNEVNAYKLIPRYEAAYFMKGFLQSRGYLRPEFDIVADILNVRVGEIARLNQIQVDSELVVANKQVKKNLDHLFHDEPVNPELLDTLELEAFKHLSNQGYPCTEVKSEFDAKTKELTLKFTNTTKHFFGEVEQESIEGLHENALNRFYPYKSKQVFSQKELALNEKRLLRANVVQGTYYLRDCSDNGESFHLSQRFIPGPPRTIRFGIGASTEVGPMARVRWSNNRSGPMASLLSARLQSSLRNQSLILTSDRYLWKEKPRRSLVSNLEVTRESQIDFEQILIKFSPTTVKWTRDSKNYLFTWTLGPSLESGTFHSTVDSNTKSFNTAVIDGSFEFMNHNYEFFDFYPHEGDSFNFNFGYRDRKFGFPEPSLRLDTSYVKLHELTEWGKGKLVGGMRVNAGTLWITKSISPGSLPPSVKFYGGGSDDIRGFQLNTLPKNNGEGALTRTSLKLELRKTHLFINTLEGIIFVDGAYFGDQSFTTTPELFYSPGYGVRWYSPIGIVQGFIAKAMRLNPNEDNGLLLYAGLGGTF